MNLKIDINVCRVCLKSGNGISLFTTENFSDKYRYCTNLKVKKILLQFFEVMVFQKNCFCFPANKK